MPTPDGVVGALQLPVAAGTSKQKLNDPMVDALLDYAAFYIKWAIDSRLANLTGTSADAVPTANRHTFDPLEPRGIEVKLPKPALFVWWGGRSTWSEQTQLYAIRTRLIEMMYVFDELPHKAEMVRRSGLMNAVDAAMFQMAARQQRNDFATGSSPNGTWINTTLGDPNILSWEWEGGMMGRFGIDEGPRAERRRARTSGRDWPALKGRWRVEERVALQTLVIPDDLNTDATVTINGSDGETTETVEIMQRVLPAPDGSEQL